MLVYDLGHWVAFLGAALLLNLSPGPDIAFILQKTMSDGRRGGFVAMGGIWCGTAAHVAMATLGLSSILATSATAFTLITWAGAAYLIWIGIKSFRAGNLATLTQDHGQTRGSARSTFAQGVAVAALNPKVAVFFLAFLPQFVVDGAGPAWLQLATHGLMLIAVAGVVEPPIILLGSRLRSHIANHPKWLALLDRALGGVLIALGIRLLLPLR